jgi:hypothetical protein
MDVLDATFLEQANDEKNVKTTTTPTQTKENHPRSRPISWSSLYPFTVDTRQNKDEEEQKDERQQKTSVSVSFYLFLLHKTTTGLSLGLDDCLQHRFKRRQPRSGKNFEMSDILKQGFLENDSITIGVEITKANYTINKKRTKNEQTQEEEQQKTKPDGEK